MGWRSCISAGQGSEIFDKSITKEAGENVAQIFVVKDNFY